MGGVCPGCFRGTVPEEKPYYAQTPQYAQASQYATAQPQQQRPRPQPQQKTSEEDRARSDEARANAAIAAQKRYYILNAFDVELGLFCMQTR